MKLNEFNAVLKENASFSISEPVQPAFFHEHILSSEPKIKMNRSILVASFGMIALVIMVMFGILLTNYYRPYMQVSLDINPSVQFVINKYHKVIGYEAINEDGVAFLEGQKLKYKSIEDVLETLYENGLSKGYYTSTESYLLIGVWGDNYQMEASLDDYLESSFQVSNASVLILTKHSAQTNIIFEVAYPEFNNGVESNQNETYSTTTTYFFTTIMTTTSPESPSDSVDTDTTDRISSQFSESEFTQTAETLGISETKLQLIFTIISIHPEYDTWEELELLSTLSLKDLFQLLD